MIVKLQHIDTNCFYILSSTKSSIRKGVFVSPVETIKNRREQRVIKTPNGEVKRFSRVYRNPNHKRRDAVHKKPDLSQHSLVKDPNLEQNKRSDSHGRTGKKRDSIENLSAGNGNALIDKVNRKCSTKWLSYGGCIPSILQALETVNDLDEALRPWEESLSNKEKSIILKEQTNWQRALEIFDWFKVKRFCELNVIHYNIMLRILGKARIWSLVEDLWDEMKTRRISPSNSTYGTLIDVYSKGGLTEEALVWLVRMKEQGMEPDEVTMGIVVQTYKKAGEFQKAEEFFKQWSFGKSLKDEGQTINGASKDPGSLSSYTYNTLIDTYGKSGQIKEASETFALMLREGISPNTVTFNTMIHICGNHGKLDEVASLIRKMEELRCPLDTRTYNILISLHAKHDNIKMAENYFKEMKSANLEPDSVSYRTLLYAFSIRHMVNDAESLVVEMDNNGLEIDEFTQSALTRMYIEAGMIDQSWRWFMRFHLEGKMSAQCYSANIDAYGEHGHILEAEKAFICCQQNKIFGVLEFNVMIKAYGISKKYDKACDLFDKMENYGVVPDKCSYNSLIQILATADLPHRAKSYVRKMRASDLVSDCVPYCALISSFVKLGQLESAEELFKEMIGFGVEPDIVVYGVLINAFADVGSVEKSTSYVNEMKIAGLPLNAVICSSLIKLYTKVGHLKEAEETYKLLRSFDEGPDVYSSNCMIDLYTKRAMFDKAEGIFEKLKQKGDANEFSYAMMLCMYKRMGRFEEAFGIAKDMRKLGLITELLSNNHVLGLYAMNGRCKEALEIFKEMIKSAIKPDDSTFKSLGVVLVKCGISKQAVGKLEVTRREDAQRGLHAWVSALSTIAGSDDADDDA